MESPTVGHVRKCSAIYANCSQLITAVSHIHSVIFTAAPQSPRIAGASEIGACIRVEAPLAGVVAGARICDVAGRLHDGFLCPNPPQGCQSVGWLPVWLPGDRRGTGIRTLVRAPSWTRTYGLLLGGTFEVRPGSAGCSPTCRLALVAMAEYGLVWLGGCGRWLPVRLPGFSLATLPLGRSGPSWGRTGSDAGVAAGHL
jgi:hypothetical protein